MNRRTFLCGLTLGALAAAPVAEAQQAGKLYRIGLLGGSPPNSPGGRRAWEGFFQGLRDLGYVEGQNILVEGRWYRERTDRLPILAGELVQLKVDVIVAGAAPAPEAARRATSTIPIVMANHNDPVGSGLVASLARPGRNVTGMSTLSPELIGKRLQLLKEAIPGISRVAVLSNPTIPSHALELKEATVAAELLKVQLQLLDTRTPGDFAGAFSAMTKERADGVIIIISSMVYAERTRIVKLAAENRVPAVYGVKEFAEAGGLMTYGIDVHDSFRRAAGYVDKILKGAKPADLPVQQATKFEFVINLKAAKQIDLTIPNRVLERADKLIK